MASELTPSDITDFGIRRRQIRERHDMGVRQQDFAAQVGEREHGRNMGDLLTQYTRMRERLPWGYGARGLLNSGIYAKGLHDRNQDFMNAQATLQGRFGDQMEGYRLARSQLTTARESGLGDLDEIEAARIASIAAALRSAGF